MSWNVNYTFHARKDIRNIYMYIANELLVPDTAVAQIRRIMDAIHKLEDMPLRFRLYKEEPWNSRGLRVLPVDNYLVLYLPDASANIVNIVRIIYGGRDIR